MGNKTVAIVGTNLDAMVAAHACVVQQHSLAVFGPPFAEHPDRHWTGVPIPSFHSTNDPDGKLITELQGDFERFRQKAYGEYHPHHNMWGLKTDFPYSIWRTGRFWEHYRRALSTQGILPLSTLLKDFDLVVVADHPQMMCSSSHQFVGRSVWVADLFMGTPSTQVWKRVFDGTPDHSWFESSEVFGIPKTFYGGTIKPPIPGVRLEAIPLYSTCTCGGDRVLRVGRGRWSTPELSLSTLYANVAMAIGSGRVPSDQPSNK